MGYVPPSVSPNPTILSLSLTSTTNPHSPRANASRGTRCYAKVALHGALRHRDPPPMAVIPDLDILLACRRLVRPYSGPRLGHRARHRERVRCCSGHRLKESDKARSVTVLLVDRYSVVYLSILMDSHM